MNSEKKRLPLGFKSKVILAFFLFNAIVSSILSITAYRVLYANMLKEIQGRAVNIVQLGSYLIDKPILKRLINKMSHGLSEQKVIAVERSDDFKRIMDQLNSIRDIEKSLIHYVYIIRPSDNGENHRYVADADTFKDLEEAAADPQIDEEIARFNSNFDASPFPVFYKAVREKKSMVEKNFYYDAVYKINSITAYAPIMDEATNTLLAVLCIDIADKNVDEALKESRNSSLIIIASSLILSLIISIILGNIFARGILALDDVVQRFTQKDFAARSSVRSNDEIGRLGFSLNYMAETIQNYAARLENLLAAYSRFVPKTFLQFLNKESITDVQLGDQTQQEMTILFSDIRSFTTLSENMTPKENFNFLNSYLKRVGPVIRSYNGFIDKYIGDGIMALFPHEPDNAVMAAIEMMRKVDEYNSHRKSIGYQQIKIGIGIHTGLLMLGTIGEEERMDGSVISDSVNLCSRMEGLTKFYGSPIIISRETMKKLKDQGKYNIRFLDKVQVKGKNIPVSIYEVYNTDPSDIIEKKDMGKQALEQAIALYFERKLDDALNIFLSLQKDCPWDMLVQLYVKRCEKYIKDGIPDDWTGIEVLGSK